LFAPVQSNQRSRIITLGVFIPIADVPAAIRAEAAIGLDTMMDRYM
jgi:hypothetical protein